LPDVRVTSTQSSQAKATFVLDDGSPDLKNVEYSLGDKVDVLKCFSVFDSKSVLIHLDQSNRVNFTPAQIVIFDKVADTISKLEKKLLDEKNSRKKDNPFQSMFLDNVTSETALFCKNITGATKPDDFLKIANFDPKTDEIVMSNLSKQIEEKKKLDIPKKKVQLITERQGLEALKATLQSVLEQFADRKIHEINQLVKDILDKKKIVESLSTKSFDDGILKTIGSSEWKTLIRTAKELYNKEKTANDNKELDHCILCHQKLKEDSKLLFQKYWQFLESKAEEELSQLILRQSAFLQDLRLTKTTYPKFLATDAGVKVLKDDNSQYLSRLNGKYELLKIVIDEWTSKIERLQEVNHGNIPTIDLTGIDTIISAKTNEESKLVNPADEITKLTAQLDSLKHKKEVMTVKSAALEYISFLNWLSKTESVSFSGIKSATTKKRTQSFLLGVLHNYHGVFNQELTKLDCDFDLVMSTGGEQGNTVKEYKLNFAEDYNPSQILSEGEQNACSLADFLTEVQLDNENFGIIFDDPVTSLDHERKYKIAKRLVEEAGQRQVVIFTHDVVFMSQLVKHANKNRMPITTHWMKKVDGVCGCVEENTSPSLASLTSLKNDSQESVKNIASLGAKEQERALGIALNYLRSACEALIQEVLFADTIQRYEDQIRVQNLNDAVFDQASALKIVDLHGKISEIILAHNKSDQQRENPPTLKDFNALYKEFDELEASLKVLHKTAVIVITLTLKADLNEEKSREIVIKRNFRERKEKLLEINGEPFKKISEFWDKLKEEIFNSNVEKPSFRQIVSRNIRDDKRKLEHTLKILSYTSHEAYEALYLFWFGIRTDSASQKQRLQEAKNREDEAIHRLRKENTLSGIRQALSVIERDIEELNAEKTKFSPDDNYENDILLLNETKAKLNQLSTEIGKVNIRKELILESKADLEKEAVNINMAELEAIYQGAQKYIPGLQLQFNQLVNFHNNMLREKIKYVTNELPEIEKRLKSLYTEVSKNIKREKELTLKLTKGAIGDLEEIIHKLNNKYEQKGKHEETLRLWTNANSRLEEIEKQLKAINEGIASQNELLDKNIVEFNKYFSKLSQRFYNEQFILSTEKNERAYGLMIRSIDGNLGTGKKKGQIAAFDFSYIQFCDANKIPCLHFIVHDQIETIHDNQLNTLSAVSNEINCQYIAPVLRDKMPPEIDVNLYKILALSQEEKLFKI
jgi:uncharacterized protein YydD (DUF2326 family)